MQNLSKKEFLEWTNQEGKTIIFCSHILEDVDRLVDKVLVLHKGRNLYCGMVADLIAHQEADTFVDAFLKIVGTTNDSGQFN